MTEPLPWLGWWDLTAPLGQHVAAEGGEPHPLGEALTVDFPAQHPELDQPDEMVFTAPRAQAVAAEAIPVGMFAQLAAAEGAVLELAVEVEAKWQALHGPAGAHQGADITVERGNGHRTMEPGLPLSGLRSERREMLLLASASPARRRLLEQAAIPHRVQVSGIDEDAITDPDPKKLVQALALAKARAVLAELRAPSPGELPITTVLGCDSVLAWQGEVFGKPVDAQEAISRWRRMAGGWGELHTGHCLLGAESADGGQPSPLRLTTITTRVQFAALSPAEIDAYVATGEPLACAGGFALEGRGGALVERIEGCFSNVIGLSLPLLRRWLAET